MPNIKPISDFKTITIHLFSELAKGEKSAREEGWLSLDEVEASLGINT